MYACIITYYTQQCRIYGVGVAGAFHPPKKVLNIGLTNKLNVKYVNLYHLLNIIHLSPLLPPKKLVLNTLVLLKINWRSVEWIC